MDPTAGQTQEQGEGSGQAATAAQGMAATSAADAAPQSSQSSPDAQAPSDDFIRVPRKNLEAYGGDFHAALAEAKKAQHYQPWEKAISRVAERFGSPEQFSAFLEEVFSEDPDTDDGSGNADDGSQGGQADPQSMSKEMLQEFISEQVRQGIQEGLGQFQQTQEQARQQQTRQQGLQMEANHRAEALKSVGIEKPSDGEPGTEHSIAEYLFDQQIEAVRRESAPPWLQGQKLRQYLDQPANESELKQAQDRFKSQWADTQQKLLAMAAKGQADTPAASLGDGQGGNPQPNDFSKMSHKQRVAEITRGLKSVHPE